MCSNTILCGCLECIIMWNQWMLHPLLYQRVFPRKQQRESFVYKQKHRMHRPWNVGTHLCGVRAGIIHCIVYCVSFMQGCSSDGRNMYKIKYSMCLKNNSKLARLGFGILSKYEENKQSKSVKQRFLNMNRHYPIFRAVSKNIDLDI